MFYTGRFLCAKKRANLQRSARKFSLQELRPTNENPWNKPIYIVFYTVHLQTTGERCPLAGYVALEEDSKANFILFILHCAEPYQRKKSTKHKFCTIKCLRSQRIFLAIKETFHSSIRDENLFPYIQGNCTLYIRLRILRLPTVTYL